MELLKLWKERKEQFGECMELQLFMRDAYQADNWIAKQEVRTYVVIIHMKQLHGNFHVRVTY